jgi:hypothetical protein
VPLTPVDPIRQLSLFGVEAAEPSPADLAGLLAGPGQLVRMGGTARVSVRVDAAWRVHALIPELVVRGFTASWVPLEQPRAAAGPPVDPDPAEDANMIEDADMVDHPDRAGGPDAGDDADVPGHLDPADADADAPDHSGQQDPVELADPGGGDCGEAGDSGGGAAAEGFEVRTAYSSRLSGLGRAWLDGTAKRAPERFFLSGPRLRLWAVAAGSLQPGGYVLRLGADDGERTWAAVDAALTRAGVPGVIGDGPTYRITGRRRLARLAELVGERPPATPAELWPGA